MPQSHFLKLPSFDGIYGKITRNVNPSPPDEHIVRWLRAQAPRLAQRDEGDKSAIPAGLYAFFCGNISLSQVVELIKARHSHDEKSVQLMRNQFRNNKVELRIPRLPHPLHAVQTQQALAGPLGSWLPPTFCPLQLSRDFLLYPSHHPVGHSGPLGYWLHLGTLRGAAVRERCAGDVQV